MGTEICDSTYSSYNNYDTTPVNTQDRIAHKNKIKQEYYHFFDYNNKEAWGENIDVFEQHRKFAQECDTRSADGKMCPDGYLSKEEYNNFRIRFNDRKITERFIKAEITEEEKRIIREDSFMPDSIEDSPFITSKDIAKLKKLSNISGIACITGLAGAVELCITGLVVGETTATIAATIGYATAGIGLGVAIVGGILLFAHKKRLEKKVALAEQELKQQKEMVEIKTENETKSEGI